MDGKDMILEETVNEENMTSDTDIEIDDTEDEEATLDKGNKDENVFKNEEVAEKKRKLSKAGNITKKVVVGVAFAASLVVIAVAAKALIFHEADEESFAVDNPEDPNSYSNVAMSIEENNIIPMYKFSVQGDYTAFDNEDIYSEYHFDFEPSGYFEGHSSVMDDDYGTWDMTSDGDNYYIVVSCTETEDKYKLEMSDDNIIMLTQKDKTYTLTPREN